MSAKKTTAEFIQNGISRFGNRFDYSESEYITAHKTIKISCRKHGPLGENMTPNKHLRRDGGCKGCKSDKAQKKYVMPIEAFMEIVKELQPTLDYSNNKQFKNLHEDVTYFCSICGHMGERKALKAIAGQGCGSKECVSNKLSELKTYSKEHIVELANAVHRQGHYSYVNSKYKGSRELMYIWCNYCSYSFPQTPDAHINQQHGCPKCGDYIKVLGDVLPEITRKGIFVEGTLYIFHFYSETESFFKIGISRKPSQRYRPSKTPYDYELILELPIGMIEAIQHEQFILKEYSQYSYRPEQYFAGWTECLSVNPLELDIRLKEIALGFEAS